MSIARDMADLIGTAVKSSDSSISEVIALTQAEYDGLTPESTTLYVVTD